jgi:hypothetical protein
MVDVQRSELHELRPVCAVCFMIHPRPIVMRAIATVNGHTVCETHMAAAAVSNDFNTVMAKYSKQAQLMPWKAYK